MGFEDEDGKVSRRVGDARVCTELPSLDHALDIFYLAGFQPGMRDILSCARG
jgi:hypothetical protein